MEGFVFMLYCIYDADEKKQIWNSRGGAYKDEASVFKKLNKLKQENPDKMYQIMTFTFSGAQFFN